MRIERIVGLPLLLMSLAISGCSEKKVAPVSEAVSSSAQATPNVEPQVNEEKKPTVVTPVEPTLVKTDAPVSVPDPQAKPAEPARDAKTASTAPSATTTPTETTDPAVVAVQRPFSEAKLLPSDTVGLIVAHPKQFLETPVGKMLKDLGLEREVPNFTQVLQQTNLSPSDIERFVVVFDQSTINSIARQSGLPIAEQPGANPAMANDPAADNVNMRNNLKQIGLAFHNYHDVNNRFPRVDGDGSGQHTGLSWRVHLLPYLDHAALYNQFKFDEPWDSEHNKTLIDQMPQIFKTPDVTEPNHTAIQVFTGEKTVFHGDTALGIRDITDGTSNTILCAKVGADKANVWTKPEGIEVDLSDPKAAFGEIEAKKTFVLYCDGSVRNLSLELDATTLANLIQPADGNPVDDIGDSPATVSRSFALPTFVVSLAKDVDREGLRQQVLSDSTEETHEGQTFHANKTTALWFADNRTIVVGTAPAVKAAIDAQKAKGIEPAPLIQHLHLDTELTFAFDVQSQFAILQLLLQLNPMLGMLNNLKIFEGGISANGKPDDALVEIVAIATDAQMATGFAGIATLGVGQLQLAVKNQPLPPSANESDKEMNDLIKKIATSAKITTDEDKVRLRILVPDGFDRLPELLKPTLERR